MPEARLETLNKVNDPESGDGLEVSPAAVGAGRRFWSQGPGRALLTFHPLGSDNTPAVPVSDGVPHKVS